MKTLRTLTLFALGSALLAAQQPPQQAAPPEDDPGAIIRTEVNLVNVLASVRNKQGGLVGNLAKDDFTIFEDGKPQTIRYFDRETNLPLTIGLLVDVSRSQERLIDIEKQAASQFFTEILRQKDLAFLISFGEECELLQDYTSSPRLLRAGLNGLKVNAPVYAGPMTLPGPVPTAYTPRGTVLFDAVYLAAGEKLKGQVGRKVIVLITDGSDQGSRLKIADALRAVQMADAVIYSIYFFDPAAYGGYGFGSGGDGDLRRMSEQTGGRVFKVDHKHSLMDAFKEIQEEMRTQYAIGYTPANAGKDGTFRKIEIKTAAKDLKVQARKGYFATRPEEQP
jgi:VWFA-related protein